MKHFRCFLLFGLTMLWCQALFAKSSMENFDNQLSHFYLAPSRVAFESLQKNANRFRRQLELETKNNGVAVLVAVMIARISQKYHWPIREGSFGRIARDILEGRSRFAKYVNDDSIVDPEKLDIWWASFFATGDEKYLRDIFKYAGQKMPDGDTGTMLVIGAATWSFKANCRQHKKVLDFARRQLAVRSLSKAQRTFVERCIAFAEKEKPKPSAPTHATNASRGTAGVGVYGGRK